MIEHGLLARRQTLVVEHWAVSFIEFDWCIGTGRYDHLHHGDTVSIRQNSFYTLTGALAQVAVTLFTVPIFLRLIGTERYGVLVIVWAFLGFFGVFDLGLGRATAQRIASLHKATPLERAEVFWTALTLNAAAGVVGGLLVWPVTRHFFLANFEVSASLRLEVLSMVPWMAAAVPVAIVTGVLSGALQGREQFLALSAGNALGAVLYQIFPLAVAWLHGPNLAWLVASALLGRVVVFAVQYVQCYRYVPLNIAPSVKRELVAPLFRYGGWVTVTGIIAPLLTTLDRFVIGSIAGASALTYYSSILRPESSYCPQVFRTRYFHSYLPRRTKRVASLAMRPYML